MPPYRRRLLGTTISITLVSSLALWFLFRHSGPDGRYEERFTVDGIAETPSKDAERKTVTDDVTSAGVESTATRFGRLEGRVLFESSGEPAAGATVVAFLWKTQVYAARVLTGAEGDYTIPDLAPGSYQVRAWSGTWTVPRVRIHRQKLGVVAGEITKVPDMTLVQGISVSGQVVEKGSEEPLEGIQIRFGRLYFTVSDTDGDFVLEGVPAGPVRLVASGEFHAARRVQLQARAGDEPFVRIQLPPGGVIYGVVTDHTGKPAEGVSVTAEASNVSLSAETDSDGQYRLGGVPLDVRDLTVTASRDGRFESTATVEGFPMGESEVRLDLELQEGFILAGRVVDNDGSPVPGAKIFVDWSSWEVLAESDPEGEFHLEGCTARMQMLTARKRGYAPVSLSLKGLSGDAREEIELVLSPGDVVSGRVIDDRGNFVRGAWVYVSTEENHAGPYPSTVSDEEGRFYFDDLPRDLKGIGVLKTGYADNRGNPVEAGQQDVELVLEEGGVIEGIVVDKRTGEYISPTTIRVTFSDSSPARWSGRGISSHLLREGVRFSRKDGSFSLREDIEPGVHYKLIVSAKDYAEAVLEDVAAWRVSETRQPVRVELDRGAVILGSVVSAFTGEPIEGVKIRHIGMSSGAQDYWIGASSDRSRGVRETVTDEKGGFELAGIHAEPGNLLLEKVGFARTVIEGVLPSPTARAIALADEAILEGTVTGPSGEALRGVSIGIEIDGQTFDGGLTNPSGAFRVAALPAGAAKVSIQGRNTLGRTERTDLVEGQVTTLDVSFTGGSISGRATLAGVPVPGARVDVTSLDGTAGRQHIETDAEGRFRLQGLKPGTYKLRARRAEDRRSFYEGAVATVDVTTGETVCEIEFPAGRLAGQVVESGRPVSGVHVALTRKGGREPFKGLRRAGSGGWVPYGRQELAGTHEFSFDALEPGLYFITVARAWNQPICAWAGPFELSRDSAVIGIVVELGGERQLSVRVVEEGSAQPIENAWASLRPLETRGVRIGGQRSENDRIGFSDVPAGRYVLNVEGPEHMAYAQEVDVSKADADLEVGLKPATWIVVDFDGTAAVKEGHQLVATVLSGGDPDWSWISTDKGLPKTIASYDPRRVKEPRIQIKTRPGEYRIRFEIAPVRNAMEETAFIDEERTVIVPERGAAKLQYTISGN